MQRHLVTGHLDGHAGCDERTSEPRDRGDARTHQHRHLGPRHVVLEMGPAQQVGDVVGLGAARRERVDVDLALAVRAVGRHRLTEGAEGLGVDRALHADPVRDPARRGQQPLAEATGRRQRDHVGRAAVDLRELGRELEDAAHVGAAERVDALVGVTDDDQVAAVAGDRLQQPDLGGVGVLVLVDVDRLELTAELGADVVGLGEQDRAVDELGVVEHGLEVEHLEVLRHERTGRDPLRPVGVAADPDQLLGLEAELAGAGQHAVHLAREPAGAQGRAEPLGPGDVALLQRVLEQGLDADVLLRGAEQPQRGEVEVGGLVLPQQGVAERVERRAHRHRRRAAETGRDLGAELVGGLAAERQDEDLVGRQSLLLHALDDRLDQRRRLARAGSGEHEQRAAGVLDHAALGRVEVRPGGVDPRGRLQAITDRHAPYSTISGRHTPVSVPRGLASGRPSASPRR